MDWCIILGHSIKNIRNVEFCSRCGYPFESLGIAWFIITRKKIMDWVNNNLYVRWKFNNMEMTRAEYNEFV